MLSYIKPYKQLVGQLFLGLLLGSLIQLILPFLTQSIVDFGINNQNLNYVYLVLLAQLTLSISNAGVGFIRGWILLHLGTRINISLISAEEHEEARRAFLNQQRGMEQMMSNLSSARIQEASLRQDCWTH